VINFDKETEYFSPDYLKRHKVPDMTSPSALRLRFVQEHYINVTDNVIAPEDIDTFDPEFITWNLNILDVFTAKMELMDLRLFYGDLFSSLQDPFIIIKHYDPLTNLDHRDTRIVRPGMIRSARKRCQSIFLEGIIPALRTHGINPEDFPVCFKRWHKCIHALLEERFISDDFRYNGPLVISCDSQSVNLTFYPNRAASSLIVNHQGRRFVQPRDTGIKVVPPAPFFTMIPQTVGKIQRNSGRMWMKAMVQ